MRFFSRDLLSMLRAMSENTAQYTQFIKTKAWLAIEKKELEIKIDQLPKNRREIIRQRIEALGKVDRNANFFNLSPDFILGNEARKYTDSMSISDYLDFVSDDDAFESIPIPQLAKLLMNTQQRATLPIVISLKKNYGDVVNIKLERDNYDPELTDEEAKHITEHEIDTYEGFDYIIKNRSLKDLKRSALEVVRDEENYEGSAVTIS